MKYALSTSWHGISQLPAEELISRAADMGFKDIELGFHLSPGLAEDYISAAARGLVRISSVHSVCPVPEEFTPGEFFPDHFSLASRNESERQRAVALALNTLELAQRSRAQVMVVHGGRVEIPDRTRQLCDMVKTTGRESTAYQRLLLAMRQERERAKPPHLTALLKSLDVLLPCAERRAVVVALETRYYYRELPGLDEFEPIFRHYGASPYLRYWHDVGHAQVADYLGVAAQRDFLDRYAGLMCGIHLHDCRGCDDHRLPGQGTFDFGLLRPYLRPDVIRVIEVHPPVGATDMAQALRVLAAAEGAV
jgi:sugar phosphate isomerase/epimerase